MPSLAAGQSGQRPPRDCKQLGTQDFNRIGERVMGRMLGSPQAHESMDRLMAQMMGPGNERRMHVLMGQRFTGCGSSALPGGYAGMMGGMGMMGAMGMMGGGSAGDRGAQGPGHSYGAGMMGFDGGRGGSRDDDAPLGWMIAMMVVLVLAAGAAIYLIARSSRRRADPGQLLAQRFARGEIDAEEYRRRNELLGGAK